jgi:hypothetical protein
MNAKNNTATVATVPTATDIKSDAKRAARKARKPVVTIVTNGHVAYSPDALSLAIVSQEAEKAFLDKVAEWRKAGVWTPELYSATRNAWKLARFIVRHATGKTYEARTKDALRVYNLKMWRKDCNGSDAFTTQKEAQALLSVNVAWSAFVKSNDLEVHETRGAARGGKREGAGAKGTKDAQPSKAASAPAIAPDETGKAAKSEPALTVAPKVKNAKGAAQWFREARELFHALPRANDGLPLFKDANALEAIEIIETQLARLETLASK